MPTDNELSIGITDVTGVMLVTKDDYRNANISHCGWNLSYFNPIVYIVIIVIQWHVISVALNEWENHSAKWMIL